MVIRPPDPPLEDELVHLRPWIDADVAAIVAACNDPEIVRWTTVPTPYSPEDARAWLARCETAWTEGAAPLAVIERSSGELAAAITLWLHGRVGELGYWAAPSFRGRGYVPRAVQLPCARGFDELDLPRMQLRDVSRQHRVRARGGEEWLYSRRRPSLLARAARRAPGRDDVVAPTRRSRVARRSGARAVGG
jgi:hypothetical protein